jgi:hypothetical protein
MFHCIAGITVFSFLLAGGRHSCKETFFYYYISFQVWDTVRRVRCLWEGNIRESLSVSLAIGMLSQEIVTFSGDTAVAHLEIQVCDSYYRK